MHRNALTNSPLSLAPPEDLINFSNWLESWLDDLVIFNCIFNSITRSVLSNQISGCSCSDSRFRKTLVVGSFTRSSTCFVRESHSASMYGTYRKKFKKNLYILQAPVRSTKQRTNHVKKTESAFHDFLNLENFTFHFFQSTITKFSYLPKLFRQTDYSGPWTSKFIVFKHWTLKIFQLIPI